MAHAGGRPSKYSEAYCNEAIEFLAQGFSITAFAGEIGVSRETIYAWEREKPEFSDALKIGKAKSALFWERRLQSGDLLGPQITATIFALKNRVADEWRDRVVQEHTGADGGPIKTEDVNARELIERRIAGIASRIGPGGGSQGDQ